MHIRSLLFSLIALVFFASCDRSRVFEDNADIKDHMWDTSQVVAFDVPITDTASPHNFYVNVRNADAYPYQNLFLFIRTKFPDGRTSNDTLEIMLADEKGRWLGDGLGDIWDNQILFKKNVRFPLSGTYRFEYRQAMRDNPLPLIMDVGIRIEKAD